MDLHDTVIQQLFAIGLSLEATSRRVEDDEARRRIHLAVEDLDGTIKRIRSTIFSLGEGAHGAGRGSAAAGPGAGRRAGADPAGPSVGGVRRARGHAGARRCRRRGGQRAAGAAVERRPSRAGVHGGDLRGRRGRAGACGSTTTVSGRRLVGAEGTGGLGLGNLARRAVRRGGEFRLVDPSRRRSPRRVDGAEPVLTCRVTSRTEVSECDIRCRSRTPPFRGLTVSGGWCRTAYTAASVRRVMPIFASSAVT